MTMRELEELLPEVLPYAPNAPEIAVLKHLRDAARQFCEASKAWRDNDTIEIAAPEWEGLCTTSEVDIVAIEQAQLDGSPLTPKTVKWLDETYRDWRTNTDENAARFITQLQPNSVTIYPRQTGTLDVGLVLKPARTALTVPDWLITQYGLEVAAGAIGELLAVPGTDYQNLQIAGPKQLAFRGFIAKHARQSRTGQQGAKLRTKGVFF